MLIRGHAAGDHHTVKVGNFLPRHGDRIIRPINDHIAHRLLKTGRDITNCEVGVTFQYPAQGSLEARK